MPTTAAAAATAAGGGAFANGNDEIHNLALEWTGARDETTQAVRKEKEWPSRSLESEEETENEIGRGKEIKTGETAAIHISVP